MPFALAVVMLLLPGAPMVVAQTPANACGLVTAAEFQGVLGGAVNLKSGAIGEVQVCSGEGQTGKVTVRFFKRTGDPSGAREQAGIEAVKKMGAQVDVTTSGGIMCMTIVPPAQMPAMGYATTCTVMSKAPTFAVIEISAKAQKDMVPIDKLRPIAERIATRF
jgi:hypothetical protein